MKKLSIFPGIFALVACNPPAPEPKCMEPNEVGIIKTSKDWTRDLVEKTSILVEVKGVVRVCQVNGHSAELLTPGTKVSLVNATRKY